MNNQRTYQATRPGTYPGRARQVSAVVTGILALGVLVTAIVSATVLTLLAWLDALLIVVAFFIAVSTLHAGGHRGHMRAGGFGRHRGCPGHQGRALAAGRRPKTRGQNGGAAEHAVPSTADPASDTCPKRGGTAVCPGNCRTCPYRSTP
jgi:hypothetical protein